MFTKYAVHKIYLVVCAVIILHATFLTAMVDGMFMPERLRYYTIISNFMLGIGFLIMALLKETSALRANISLAVLTSITITGLVYNLILVPFGDATAIFVGYTNFVTHLLSMLLALANYFIFEEKGYIKLNNIPAGLAPGVLYWIVFVAIGDTIDFRPYFFMNSEEIGWIMVFVWFIVIVVFMSIITVGIIMYDRIKGKPRQYVRNHTPNPYEDVL